MPVDDVVDPNDGVEQQPGKDNGREEPPQVVGAYPLKSVQKHQHGTRNAHHQTCMRAACQDILLY